MDTPVTNTIQLIKSRDCYHQNSHLFFPVILHACKKTPISIIKILFSVTCKIQNHTVYTLLSLMNIQLWRLILCFSAVLVLSIAVTSLHPYQWTFRLISRFCYQNKIVQVFLWHVFGKLVTQMFLIRNFLFPNVYSLSYLSQLYSKLYKLLNLTV